jgi:cell division protein FtsI/penicillin-binding protein 2
MVVSFFQVIFVVGSYIRLMDISRKTNRILHLFSICLILFLIRIWYLGVVQHDYHVEQSKKPQLKVVIEKAPRATIQDRFGTSLAVNKIQYNATISYANIREIPRFSWKTTPDGKRVRCAERSAYITQLSQLLGAALDLDAVRIEDTIHGKAALLPHTPFIIKEDISEEQYFRLRMLEKDWVGLHAERASRRHYPLGKVGCNILGYLGTMDQKKYLQIAEEIETLEEYLRAQERGEKPFLPTGFNTPEEAEKRWAFLREKAYTMNDLIGKSGIEAQYEEDLRGSCGKHFYEIDRKGHKIGKLPHSSCATPGKKLTLTISAELQDFAEKLLSAMEGSQSEANHLTEAWMRGGAAVAMIPQTGEVVALASYPRFDPNDFIPTRDAAVKKEKEQAVHQWLEDEEYLGAIWEGRRPIEREYFSFIKGKYLHESLPLTWPAYLKTLLEHHFPLQRTCSQITALETALQVQQEKAVDDDALVVHDLCHLVAPQELFSEELIAVVGKWEIAEHFLDQQMALQLLGQIREEITDLYTICDFKEWRSTHFKAFLKRKRAEEKQEKRYARPYTDYLDRCEKQLFQAFWDTYKSLFLYITLTGKAPVDLEEHPHLRPYTTHLQRFYLANIKDHPSRLGQKMETLTPTLALDYLKTFRSFQELESPLQGKYCNLRSSLGKQLEKHLASAFYPLYGYGFSRAQAYSQISAPGSVFKLVTVYQILMERLAKGKHLNPLTLIDDLQGDHRSTSPKQILGYHLDGTPIYRSYKGGRLPRSDHGGMGRIDLIGALEQSSNIYFSIAAEEQLEDPSTLSRAAKSFSFGERTGIDLPGEAKGSVPDDLNCNLNGLFSFAIGQHTLTVTPLQTAVMVSALSNQGKIVKPHILQRKGEKEFFVPEIKRSLPLPAPILEYLFAGMRKAVMGPRGTARPSIMRQFYDHPDAKTTYLEIHPDILVKTGTAQEFYKPSIIQSARGVMKDHICFAAIAYPKGHLDSGQMPQDPELVVVVYLRFRGSGREGATIAGQIIKKWRELSR